VLFNYIFIALAVLSVVLLLWQWIAALRFPLHEPVKDKSFNPPVTLLKPLKGCDSETRRCLESWFEQDYGGPVQLLFGVASREDAVCDLLSEVIAQFPAADAQLVICDAMLGPNAKVSSLIQLEAVAKHEIIVISDADVKVPKELLSNVVAPLAKEDVGLVNCFYRFANPTTLAMRWEAIAVNADFWSQVLQSRTLKPIDFALGAVMTTSRTLLKQSGGFETLVDYLADDYQLGNRIARKGKRIALSSIVAECWEAPRGWSDIWQHQLRWARTIRICQPVPFFFSILSNATLWPLLLFTSMVLTRHSYRHSLNLLLLPLLLGFSLRLFVALKLEERLTREDEHYTYFWLIPVKDLLNVGIWAFAFFGNEVQWRGERFIVLPGGKLQKQR
jgi:ceramide glucosyltransferase